MQIIMNSKTDTKPSSSNAATKHIKCKACGEALNTPFKTCKNCGRNHTVGGGFLKLASYCGAILSLVGVIILIKTMFFNPLEKYVSIEYVGPNLDFEVSNYGEKKAEIKSVSVTTYISLPRFLSDGEIENKVRPEPVVQMKQFHLSINKFNRANQTLGVIEPILPNQTKKISFNTDINLLGGTNHLNYVHNKLASEHNFPVELPSSSLLYPELVGKEDIVYGFCNSLNEDTVVTFDIPEGRKDGVLVPFTCKASLEFKNQENNTFNIDLPCESVALKKIRSAYANAFGACNNIYGLLNDKY